MTERVFNNCTFGVIADTVHSLSVTIAQGGSMMVNETPSVVETMAEEMEELSPLPDILLTDEARDLHARFMEAGMVDEAWMPVGLSGAERGVLAFQLAVRLDIQNPWQVFAPLWGTTPGALRSAYNRANEQRKTLSFIEKLNNILG